MKQNKAFNPLKIRFLRPMGQLPEPHDFPALIQEFQFRVGVQPLFGLPLAAAKSRIHELGQTYSLTFFHKPAIFNHMKRKARTLLPDLGQTAVWPNTC